MKNTATPTPPTTPDELLSPLVPATETTPDWFPELRTLSPAFLFRMIPVPDVEPTPPEYVFLPQPGRRTALAFDLATASWNSLWEAGPFAADIVDSRRLPRQLRWLRKANGRNIRLVPRFNEHRYHAYAALYHLIPAQVLREFGLPLLKRGGWPHLIVQGDLRPHLPADFDERLAKAFSRHMWPLLNGRGGQIGFSRDEPIKVLSHHLDYWLPYIDVVAQRRMRLNGRCEPDLDDVQFSQDVARVNRLNANSGATAMRPLRGGHLWMGEADAREAAQELVDAADEHGRLRDIIDAVKSHRAQDDFSSVWSYEREDFERKMYRRRAKAKVTFVEMPNTVPVYSEDTEVHEHLLWGDFMALLDAKERRVVVCLRRGAAGVVDIAKELGYANHSPVSKALARIRRKAIAFLES